MKPVSSWKSGKYNDNLISNSKEFIQRGEKKDKICWKLRIRAIIIALFSLKKVEFQRAREHIKERYNKAKSVENREKFAFNETRRTHHEKKNTSIQNLRSKLRDIAN